MPTQNWQMRPTRPKRTRERKKVKIANTKVADAADKAKKDEGKTEAEAANKTAYDKLRKEADTAIGKASDAKIAFAKATESTSKFRTSPFERS